MTHKPRRDVEKVAEIIRAAGGRVVGRTRLQKIAYILEIAGVGEGFPFEYRHYGPYSESLSVATRGAKVLGLVDEEEHVASWGGAYSVYTTNFDNDQHLPAREAIAQQLVNCDSVELELAATAAFLSLEGHQDPWSETAKRKPEKAEAGRIDNAKRLYRRILEIDTPKELPHIVG